MPGRHTFKARRAERAAHRRAAEVVDAHTLAAHLLTPDALIAGQHAAGRYMLSAARKLYQPVLLSRAMAVVSHARPISRSQRKD